MVAALGGGDVRGRDESCRTSAAGGESEGFVKGTWAVVAGICRCCSCGMDATVCGRPTAKAFKIGLVDLAKVANVVFNCCSCCRRV